MNQIDEEELNSLVSVVFTISDVRMDETTPALQYSLHVMLHGGNGSLWGMTDGWMLKRIIDILEES